MSATCSHLDTIRDVAATSEGCEECLAIGATWVHLRRCTACGHVGCCDSSPNRHATAHYQQALHPVVQSYEPGEEWYWCYADSVSFELASDLPSPSHP